MFVFCFQMAFTSIPMAGHIVSINKSLVVNYFMVIFKASVGSLFILSRLCWKMKLSGKLCCSSNSLRYWNVRWYSTLWNVSVSNCVSPRGSNVVYISHYKKLNKISYRYLFQMTYSFHLNGWSVREAFKKNIFILPL